MSNQSWSVKIEERNGGLQFTVDAFGYSPGQPLQAQKGDTICWNNLTNATHQPYLSDSSGNPQPNGQLSDPIPGGASSTPAYVIQQVAPQTLYYVSLEAPKAGLGQISVVL